MSLSQAELMVVAETGVHAWLARDFDTLSRAQLEAAESGASVEAVFLAVCLAAAAVMTDACGGSSARAARFAAARLSQDVAAQARLLLAAEDGAG